MARNGLSDPQKAVLLDALLERASLRVAARKAQVAPSTAARFFRNNRPSKAPRADGVTREEGETEGSVSFSSRTPIRTMDDAVRHAEIDLTVWRVESCKIVSGEVAMKVQARESGKITGDRPHVEPVWWITLKLKRVMRKPDRDSLEGLFTRIKARPKDLRIANLAIRTPDDPHLMVLDLVDLHFGKLAWAPETGQHYDLKIADRVYRDAVTDLLIRSSNFPVDEFLVPLGSDFLHIDTASNTTTAGTAQDVDGRLAKILEVAEAAVVWAVEGLASRGRVVVRWVPGNHDRLLSYCLARTIGAYFRNDRNVTVDVAPTARKYHRYHSTLIGLAHGDAEKHQSLPGIMAVERPLEWAVTTCREWHVGHRHQSRRLDFMGTETHGGVPVRTLRSLSGLDSWHYGLGFVGTQRSAEAYLYSREGYVGHFVADVRKDQK